MARKVDGTRHRKPRPLSSKANAAGYAKRHSRKAENQLNVSDVYEYQSGKTRRSKVALDLSRDEAGEFLGHDSDNEDADRENARPKARLVGENGEDEKLDSEDDEEIDSDNAFEESDEERFAGFNFSYKVRVAFVYYNY
jgi:U3 small nucleolar RNA-associated protein 14